MLRRHRRKLRRTDDQRKRLAFWRMEETAERRMDVPAASSLTGLLADCRRGASSALVQLLSSNHRMRAPTRQIAAVMKPWRPWTRATATGSGRRTLISGMSQPSRRWSSRGSWSLQAVPALRQSELDLQGTFDGVHVLASQDAEPLGQPVLGSRRDLIRHGLLSPAANMHHCLARKHSASNRGQRHHLHAIEMTIRCVIAHDDCRAPLPNFASLRRFKRDPPHLTADHLTRRPGEPPTNPQRPALAPRRGPSPGRPSRVQRRSRAGARSLL